MPPSHLLDPGSPATLGVRRILGASVQDVRLYLREIASYELLIRILTVSVWGPLLALLFHWMAGVGGDGALTNEDILHFFLSPRGVAVLVLFLGLGLAGVMADQAGVMILFGLRIEGRAAPVAQVLWLMFRKLAGTVALCVLRAVAYLLAAAPFGILWLLFYRRYLASYDLNYLVQVQPPAFWWGVILGAAAVSAALAAVLVLHVHTAFAFPGYFFRGLSIRAALRRGFQVVRGRRLRLVGLLLAWPLLYGTVALLLAGTVELLGEALLSVVGARPRATALILGGVAAVQILVQALASAFAVAANAITVARAYLLLTGDTRLLEAGPGTDDGRFVPFSRRLAWTVVLLVLGFSVVASLGLLADADLEDRTTIMAHRGGAAVAPENSLSALRMAIEAGAEYAEIDVQETEDGVVVLLHDTDLRRVAGLDRKIWEVTYADIVGLVAGCWFSPEFQGEPMPTLSQAIATARGRIKLIIELKLNGHEERLLERVVEILEQEEFGADSIVASLDLPTLRRLRELGPDLEAGYLIFQAFGDSARLDVDYLMVKANLITPVMLYAAHEAGKRVAGWTVNDPSAMSAMIDRGVDGIITDHPRLLAELLAERKDLTNAERLVLHLRAASWR